MSGPQSSVTRPTKIDEHQERIEGDTNRSPRRLAYQQEYLDAATHQVLEDDADCFLHQSLSTPCIDAIVEAEGIYLHDLSGRKIMDFHGNGVHQVGFRHPRVMQAVKDQIDVMPFCTRRYTNSVAVDLAKKLREVTPGQLDRVLFAPGGTSAIGMAMKLARIATGRYKTISMWGSFHGASIDVISVGGQALFSEGLGPLLPGALHIRPPIADDCPFHCEKSCNANCADYVQHLMQNEGGIAAVIAEPIRWSTVTIPPAEYWQRVRAFCDEHGALLIFDEIGTGLGRTGRMFAFEHFGVEPDIVVLGKGFGGGVMPLAGIVARADLNVAGDRAIGHYTHEKNPVSCVAGLETLQTILDDDLVGRSERLGQVALDELNQLQERHACVREVRGAGLLIGVELQDHPDYGSSHSAAEKIMYGAMARGLSFKVSAGNVLTLVPPLIISTDELKRAIGIIDECLLAVREDQ